MTSHSTSAFHLSALLAAVLGALIFAAQPAEAQQGQRGTTAEPSPGGYSNGHSGPRGPGGYSLTFSDIWGPAKMPPAPMDFGPHFDFPTPGYGTQPLSGAPLHDPYPN
ncbi:MAG TPA: hypothetical protein VLB11_04325 [Methyloceanibacter sp.]|nr:hypothetical protein [Methyloceanibacter sp.]